MAAKVRRRRQRRTARRRRATQETRPLRPPSWPITLLARLWACVRPRAGLVAEYIGVCPHDSHARDLRAAHAVPLPWLNPFAERVKGRLRRELTDHVIALNAAHLQRILRESVEQYYNAQRCHMSLDGNAPIPRTRETTPVEDAVATPVVGGLHHTYRRAA